MPSLKQRRPYLKNRNQYRYWKRSPLAGRQGVEVQNYASPFARRFCYYVRSMGRVNHPAGWHCEHQNEDGFLLHVVLEGRVWHNIQRHQYDVGPQSACFVDLRQDIRYGVSPPGAAQFWWVWLNGKDLPGMFLELGADQDPVFPLGNLRPIQRAFEQLQSLTLNEPAAYEIKSSALITGILAELFTSRADRLNLYRVSDDHRPLSDPIRKAIDYMARVYDMNVPIKKIAVDISKLTVSHFSRLFRQEVGMTPVDYLNQFRIEQAKKFLAHGNQDVAEIARSVGFTNNTYFSRCFVKVVGQSPLAYRKQQRAER